MFLIFLIGCELEDDLAWTETVCSVKQNRIWLCLERFQTVCIDWLNNTKGCRTLQLKFYTILGDRHKVQDVFDSAYYDCKFCTFSKSLVATNIHLCITVSSSFGEQLAYLKKCRLTVSL
jgi:hypothetical protein